MLRNFNSLFLEAQFFRAWRRREEGAENVSLQEVNEPMKKVLRLIDTLDEVAADPDSEDDLDGERCDEDGNLNVHSADAGCVRNVQLVTYCYRKVTMLWPGQASGI